MVDDQAQDWRTSMRAQLAAIGRAAAADQALAAYDARLAQGREQVAPLLAGRRVALIGVDPDQFWSFRNSFASSVATELGIDVIGYDPTAQPGNETLSAENLERFHDAALVVVQNPDSPGVTNPAFQALPAVRAGRIVTLDYADVTGFALTATDFVDDLVAGVVRHLG